MIDDYDLFKVPCYVEDSVKKHESKYSVVIFYGKDDVLDVVITTDFQLAIFEYIRNNTEDVNKEGFGIQVLSTKTFFKIMEILRK